MTNETFAAACPNPKCQREIEEPILLNSLSKKPVEQYYACPHCFMKLDVDIKDSQPLKEEEKKEEKGPSGCHHDLGYLARRPKDVPIPQECLICSKIVDCMLKRGGA